MTRISLGAVGMYGSILDVVGVLVLGLFALMTGLLALGFAVAFATGTFNLTRDRAMLGALAIFVALSGWMGMTLINNFRQFTAVEISDSGDWRLVGIFNRTIGRIAAGEKRKVRVFTREIRSTLRSSTFYDFVIETADRSYSGASVTEERDVNEILKKLHYQL